MHDQPAPASQTEEDDQEKGVLQNPWGLFNYTLGSKEKWFVVRSQDL